MKENIFKQIEESLNDQDKFLTIKNLLNELFEEGKKEKTKEIEAVITPLYDKKDHGFEYWLAGNYDDVYEQGVQAGTRDVLYDISKKIGIFLPEPETEEVTYI